MWKGGYIYIMYIYIKDSIHLHTWWFHPLQLAPVMFSLTPTVWWGSLGGGGRCICVCGCGGCCYGVLVLGKCTGVS